MDSLEQLDSSAPTQLTAHGKEAEGLKGGTVCLPFQTKGQQDI